MTWTHEKSGGRYIIVRFGIDEATLTFEPVKRGANVRGYASDECRRRFDRVIRAFGRAHFESGMSILDMEAVADTLNARNSSRATDTEASRHIEAAE